MSKKMKVRFRSSICEHTGVVKKIVKADKISAKFLNWVGACLRARW